MIDIVEGNMEPITIDVGGIGLITVVEAPSLGHCTVCKHCRYEYMKHPEWMSCHCAVPTYAVIAPKIPREDYGC